MILSMLGKSIGRSSSSVSRGGGQSFGRSRRAWLLLACTMAGLLEGCGNESASSVGGDGGSDGGSMSDAAPMPTGSIMIGAAGGHVGMPGGPTIDIPAGAVASAQLITVTLSQDAAPADALTPIYHFEPAGIVFAHPVTITLPLPAAAPSGTRMFWSTHDGSGFEEIGGTVANGVLSAQVVHFSSGYAAPGTGKHAVSGSRIVTYVTPSGIVNVPQDTSLSPPVVLTADGRELTAKGSADGSFSIANVPDGPYFLKIGNEYYQTAGATFDAGKVVAGRPGLTKATQSTTISFHVDGLDPWQPSDELEAYSAGADIWWFGSDPALTSGSTTLSGFTIDNTEASDPGLLIDGGLGDHFTLAQITTRKTAKGVPYRIMDKVFMPGPFTQTDGKNTTLSGTFASVALDRSAAVDLRASEFEAAVGYDGKNAVLLNPGAFPYPDHSGTQFAVLGMPGGTQYGLYAANADYLHLDVPLGGGDTVASDLTYGRPDSGNWGALAVASTYYFAEYSLGGTPTEFTVGTTSWDTVEHMLQSPVRPVVGPVRNATLAGVDFFQGQSFVGIQPTVAWQAPAIGKATSYVVTIYHLDLTVTNPHTEQTQVARIHTANTSIVVPANVLTANNYYVIDIAATTGRSDVAQPSRQQQYAETNIISALFSS